MHGGTALQHACSNGHQTIVHELLQHPAVDVSIQDKRGIAALNTACFHGKAQVVAELLGHPGIDVNHGHGPALASSLILACINGHVSVFEELLKHPDIRVNLNIVTSDGKEGFYALVLLPQSWSVLGRSSERRSPPGRPQ